MKCKNKKTINIIVVFVMAVVATFCMPGSAMAVASTQSMAIPAYEYPTLTNFWPSIDATDGSEIPFVVVNPASGPGTTVNSDYVTRLATNDSKNIRSIGYVDTAYQARSTVDVLADIDLWYSLYPNIDGIFLDQVSVDAGEDLCYSAYIYNYIKVQYPNSLVVQNFGTYTSPQYEPYGDIFLNAEMGNALYQSDWELPNDGFQNNSDYSNRFWHILHTTDEVDYASVIADTRANNAGWVYVTDDAMPNPYDMASTYFADELSEIGTLPSSTIPNRGLTLLPPNCLDPNLTTTSDKDGATVTSEHTVTNTSSRFAAISPSKIVFSLPNGVSLLSVSGTNWSCSGLECTYSQDIAAEGTSSVLTATFRASSSYTTGSITATSTTFAGNSSVDTFDIDPPVSPVDDPDDERLADTGVNVYSVVAVGTVLLGSGLLLNKKRIS